MGLMKCPELVFPLSHKLADYDKLRPVRLHDADHRGSCSECKIASPGLEMYRLELILTHCTSFVLHGRHWEFIYRKISTNHVSLKRSEAIITFVIFPGRKAILNK